MTTNPGGHPESARTPRSLIVLASFLGLVLGALLVVVVLRMDYGHFDFAPKDLLIVAVYALGSAATCAGAVWNRRPFLVGALSGPCFAVFTLAIHRLGLMATRPWLFASLFPGLAWGFLLAYGAWGLFGRRKPDSPSAPQ